MTWRAASYTERVPHEIMGIADTPGRNTKI